MPKLKLSELRAQILEVFQKGAHTKSPEAEATLILFSLSNRSTPRFKNLGDVSVHANDEIDSAFAEEAIAIASARVNGTPLQHLLKTQFFYEHEYQVNESVLIPRPETEILISEIIQACRTQFQDRPFRFAELGVGSGILSIEILAHFPHAMGVGSEVSAAAIEVARANFRSILGEFWEERYQLMEALQTDQGFEIFSPKGPFDLVVSNPPYVAIEDEIEEEVLNHEPHLALFPDSVNEDPNYFYENFLEHRERVLAPGGLAFFEIPHERSLELQGSFVGAGLTSVHLIPDLTGRDRILTCSRSGSR